MKTIIHATAIIVLAFASLNTNGQICGSNKMKMAGNGHGNTLNLGIGAGYDLHTRQTLGFGHLNYEIGLGRDLTLAPFVGLYTYTDQVYLSNELTPPRLYKYRETAIPVGLRASYYFDHLLGLANSWDIYGGGAAGYVFDNVRWEPAYLGDKNIVPHSKPLYLAAHAGTRYHINNRIGVFAEISSVATGSIGLSKKL